MIALCFFLSGAAALVYEVVWLRMLSLIFGHTVYATTAVLTAVMAGLGLGSALIGRVADRRPDRVVVYGVLECGIGVWCALLPAALPLVARVHLGLYRALGLSYEALSLVQFALVFLLLLPATTLMGATLPLLGRAVSRDSASAGSTVGWLYAVNTFGAVLGTVLAGYLLLDALGARATLLAAAALNLAVGVTAIALGSRMPRPVSESSPPTVPTGESRAAVPILLALGLSGAAGMVYEVAWTRVLALIIGSSTYAFTAMLVAFLVGIAIGSALWARGAGGIPAGPGMLAAILLGIAASALVMIPTFDRFPGLVAYALSLSSQPDFVLGVQLALSVTLMLGPTLLIGATFPCALGLVAREPGRVGRDVGRLYAANTAGAIVGAALAGLVLIPRLGAQNAVKGGALLQLLAAAVIVAGVLPAWAPWRRALALGLALVVAASVVVIPGWDRAVMVSGAAVYGRDYGRLIDKISLAELTRPLQLLFYEEGPTATVTVHQGGYRFLRANGKTEASTGPDMHTQLVSGHLPLLLHPEPRRVLVIGLASGITVGAVARYPVERIDVVEIEPAMTRAAQFFRRENRDVLADPRVVVTIADARSFLLTRADRWDVIISEPSNPWIGGVATLFTSEFYALAASRLNPGGLMVQWMQGYAMAPADLQMITRTFRTAFPATEVWATVPADYLLLGRAAEAPFPFERVAVRWEERAEVREDFRRVFLTAPAALLADVVLGPADTARYAEGARVNTDDRLPLEFSAARSLYQNTADANWQLMRRFRSAELAPMPDDAEARHAIGVAYMGKRLPDDALAEFDRALARDPAHVPSLLERGRVLRARGEHAVALAALEQALRREPRNAVVHYEIGVTRQARSGSAAALDAYRNAVALAPARADFMRAYATALAQEGRVTEAISYLVLARAFRPRDPALMDLTAFIYLQIGRTARAIELLQQAVAVAPLETIYHLRLGQAQMQAKNPAAALAELTRAVELRPDFVEAQLELANTYVLTSQLGPAIRTYQRVLALDPHNTMALRVLSTLLQ